MFPPDSHVLNRLWQFQTLLIPAEFSQNLFLEVPPDSNKQKIGKHSVHGRVVTPFCRWFEANGRGMVHIWLSLPAEHILHDSQCTSFLQSFRGALNLPQRLRQHPSELHIFCSTQPQLLFNIPSLMRKTKFCQIWFTRSKIFCSVIPNRRCSPKFPSCSQITKFPASDVSQEMGLNLQEAPSQQTNVCALRNSLSPGFKLPLLESRVAEVSVVDAARDPARCPRSRADNGAASRRTASPARFTPALCQSTLCVEVLMRYSWACFTSGATSQGRLVARGPTPRRLHKNRATLHDNVLNSLTKIQTCLCR